MLKYINQGFKDRNGEPLVRAISPGSSVKVADYGSLPREVRNCINGLDPRDGYGYLLVSIVSDENWGSNRNVDYFPTLGLTHKGKEWGYETFKHYGYYYRLHKNDDPKHSFGKVIESFWNPQMHRVEIIIEYDRKKDDWTEDALAAGKNIEVSMGTRIKHDICPVCIPNWRELYKIPQEEMIKITKCDNIDDVHEIAEKYDVDLEYITKTRNGGGIEGISPTQNDYCDHIKFQLGELMPDGTRVRMINLRPQFFDASNVRTHADESAYVLKKVATNKISGTITEDKLDKQINNNSSEPEKSAERKLADIEKKIVGRKLSDDEKEIFHYIKDHIAPVCRKTEPNLPNDVIDDISSKHSINEILSSFLGLGMFPTKKEFQRIFLVNHGRKNQADQFEREGVFFNEKDMDVMKDNPKIRAKITIKINGDGVRGGIIDQILPFAAGKSYFPHSMNKRIIHIKTADVLAPYPLRNSKRKSPLPAILGVAAGWFALAKGAGKSMKSILQMAAKHKTQAIAATAGVLAATEIGQMMAKENAEDKEFIQKKYYKEKESGINPLWSLGLIPAAYIGSEHYRQKGYRTPLSPVESVIAKHPMALSIGSVMLANKGSRRAIGKLLKGAFKMKSGMVNRDITFEDIKVGDYSISDQPRVLAFMWDKIAQEESS